MFQQDTSSGPVFWSPTAATDSTLGIFQIYTGLQGVREFDQAMREANRNNWDYATIQDPHFEEPETPKNFNLFKLIKLRK